VAALDGWLRAPGSEGRTVVINADDAGGAELAARLAGWHGRVVPVARGAAADGSVSYHIEGSRISVRGLPGLGDAAVAADLRLPGEHNAANAACVAAAAALLGIDAGGIAFGLGTFEGVGRRLEVKGEAAGVLVIDDYGHHPTAIRATLAAVRGRHPGRPVWVAHEPLTYHRTAAMIDDLAAALATADHVVIADIWAGRDPDTSITSAAALAAAVGRVSGDEVAAPGSVEATADHLARRVRPGDVVLAMGGGRSYVIADRLVALLSGRDAG
jgi:UDP-N-acetylmuramate--alanine ligase